jgi:hypothetical protein
VSTSVSPDIPGPAHPLGDHLDTPVRDLMSSGVLSLVEDASLHRVPEGVIAELDLLGL